MMRALTHLGGARFTIGLPLVFLVSGGGLSGAGLAALLANAASHAAVQLLKRLVARPRPCDANGHPLALVDLPDPFSFPSGHAAAATALAVTLTMAWPPAGAIALPYTVVVAVSRITLRVHYLGDVLAGIALGLAGALAAHAIVP